MNQEEARQAVKQYGSQRKACAALHMSRHTMQRILVGEGDIAVRADTASNAANVVSVVKDKRKTLADFRAIYDKGTIVPAKVKAALKELGRAGWEYEVGFAKLAGVSLSDLGNFRDLFSDYVLPVERGARRIWAGSTELRDEMRKMI